WEKSEKSESRRGQKGVERPGRKAPTECPGQEPGTTGTRPEEHLVPLRAGTLCSLRKGCLRGFVGLCTRDKTRHPHRLASRNDSNPFPYEDVTRICRATATGCWKKFTGSLGSPRTGQVYGMHSAKLRKRLSLQSASSSGTVS